MSRLGLQPYIEATDECSPWVTYGTVTDAVGLLIEGHCPNAEVGAICEIISEDRQNVIPAEIVGFRKDTTLLMPLGEARGIRMGSLIRLKEKTATIAVGPEMIGRVIDGLGNPLDGLPPPECEQRYNIYSRPINPLKRKMINQPLDLGVKAINGLLTVGKGMRLSIMAGSGVGKSVLLGMITRATNADITVLALVGERGRELREFIEQNLGAEGLQRSIVVCATSDQPPLIRMRAAYVATTIAEYFRSQGADVLLMMDSVTRFAMAQREVGLTAGEPPTTKGYPPSVFSMMPKIFERAGALESGGSITGLYTVLTEQDDINDVIGDAVRSIVDGHIALSRKLASRNHYPAVDVTISASRVMPSVVTREQLQIAGRIRAVLSAYNEAEDLINIGAYVKGTNKSIDEAIQYIDRIRDYLKQPFQEKKSFSQSVEEMKRIFA